MKLYTVYNGWWGSGDVKCFVVAENEERAIELARERYKAEADEEVMPGTKRHDEGYYANLWAEILCEDITKEFASEITEF